MQIVAHQPTDLEQLHEHIRHERLVSTTVTFTIYESCRLTAAGIVKTRPLEFRDLILAVKST